MERSHRLEPDFIRHFGHAARAVTQQDARIFDSAPCHIVPKLKACGLVEQRAEMKHAGATSLRHGCERELASFVLGNKSPRPHDDIRLTALLLDQ